MHESRNPGAEVGMPPRWLPWQVLLNDHRGIFKNFKIIYVLYARALDVFP